MTKIKTKNLQAVNTRLPGLEGTEMLKKKQMCCEFLGKLRKDNFYTKLWFRNLFESRPKSELQKLETVKINKKKKFHEFTKMFLLTKKLFK